MKFLFTTPRRGMLLVFTFLLTLPFMANRAMALQNAENQDVRNLLSLAAQQAAALDYDADQMQGLLRNDVSWQAHATLLSSVKEHVNQLGRTTAKLQAQRGEASTWQQRGIDRIVPLLRELADNTTAAINHLNKNQARPVSGGYADYLDDNADVAHELSELISATSQYGHSRAKLEKLEQRIQPST
jgi:hypothetical protein